MDNQINICIMIYNINMKKNLLTLFIFFVFTFVYNIAFAQNTNLISQNNIACPSFEFDKDMQQGVTDEDVYILQQILNLDKRTIIAQTGPGSKGRETGFFGTGTREALKRFQALFIEYIEVADGKFNSKTRNVMNTVCKGSFFTGVGKNPYDISTTTEKVAPVVGVSGPVNYELSEPFRSYLAASEPIQTPDVSAFIVEGATISDIRKVAANSFSFLVTPNEGYVSDISFQVEADAIQDLVGNKNDSASNEWVVKITGSVATSTNSNELSKILDSLTPVTPTLDCSKVGSVSISDYSNPCYGRAPMSSQSYNPGFAQAPESNNNNQGNNSLTDILRTLLTGLVVGQSTGLFGAAGSQLFGGNGAQGSSGASIYSGGLGTLPGICACIGNQPTILLTPLGGTAAPGRYLMTANPGIGDYTGFLIPTPPPICGVRLRTHPTKDLCPDALGPHSPTCCGIIFDSTRTLKIDGIIPPKPQFNWKI